MERSSAKCVLVALLIGACGSSTTGSSGNVVAVDARDHCDTPTECVVVPRTCCAHCGAAVPGDALALNVTWLRERTRQGGPPICEPDLSGCPDCHQDTALTLIATCRSSRCEVVDLSATPVTACASDADCVTTFAGCCACGSPGAISVARDREDDYRSLLCGDVPLACPECVGHVPNVVSACAEGRCAL